MVVICFATNLLVPPSAQLDLVVETHGFIQPRKIVDNRGSGGSSAEIGAAKREAVKNILFAFLPA
jgi:hypothetical protein